jgi:hypothetical protein
MMIDSQINQKKQGIKLLKIRQKWLENMDKSSSGYALYLKVRDTVNVLFLEEVSLDTIISLLAEGSCVLDHPKQGGSHRCGKYQANCSKCVKAFLNGKTKNTDIEGVKKWHGVDN